jgi:hypothetical protein
MAAKLTRAAQAASIVLENLGTRPELEAGANSSTISFRICLEANDSFCL